jgi:hypothetical protein
MVPGSLYGIAAPALLGLQCRIVDHDPLKAEVIKYPGDQICGQAAVITLKPNPGFYPFHCA